ncbi:LPXTG cell wall anchor domain-containing protein [Bacillus sp. J33]|uniref:LPXTG cell wall anchor domain-containing protein n=1 Tax=Bacillus sp. J33 TaxID=935836 RepID=UPI00047CB7C6|nr:LPXTG cell wall anchor domain-containing protein [Bacillus sp. J33]
MKMNSLLAKPKKILILSTFVILIIFGNGNAIAEEKEIDINTNSNGYLFKVGSLKPGDWMPRDITILNEGIQDFQYTAIIGNKKSVKGLFEELDLLVKKDSEVLFDGKFKDFVGFTPRKLTKGSSEQLYFQVTVPYELGNHFQGSFAEVEIVFLAEGTDKSKPNDESENPSSGGNSNSSSPPPDETVTPQLVNKLPNTATNNFNLLLIGGILLTFGSIILLFNYKKFRREY